MATQILIDPWQALLAAKFIAFAVLGVAVIIVAEHYDWPP